MKIRTVLLAIALWSLSIICQGQVTTPKDFFGFQPGTDGKLFNYEMLISYLQKLETESPMIKMFEIGESPMGKKMYVVCISAADNLERLGDLKNYNRDLALNPNIADEDLEWMIPDGKVFFLATLSMHSNEVGPSQSAPLIAYKLLTSTDPNVKSWLFNVVYMMVPNHNPDGMDMVVDYYEKTKDTPYDGSFMPGIYNKYVGHDNNRDFVNLTQSDTRAIAALFSQDWFPQVMIEKHQMGASGVRYFIPPPHDPIAENVDAELWNWIGLFGSNMQKDMTADGLKGIAQQYLFDDYWPGSTETCIWMNMIGMLTEGASCKVATPVYIEPNELTVGGKGLSEYKKSINMPEPWPGGWWHLSDIVQYEISSTMSIIKTCSDNKNEILKFRNDLCRKEVKKGLTEAPYYFVMPDKQHDRSELTHLVNLLLMHGIYVYKATQPFELDGKQVQVNDVVVPLSQPFRAFVKEIMESQTYPLRHYTPGGEIMKPYDITSWSLPLHNGVKSYEINEYRDISSSLQPIRGEYNLKEGLMTEFWGLGFSVNNNESFKAAFLAKELGFRVDRTEEAITINNQLLPAGSFLVYGAAKQENWGKLYKELSLDPVYLNAKADVKSSEFTVPRIALVETYFHDMNAGWTRYLFDQYHIPFKVLHPGDFEKAQLQQNFDVIILPGSNKDILKNGKYKSGKDEYAVPSYPPEYTKGMGDKGFENLLKFINTGGTVLSWGNSTELFFGPLKIKLNENENEEFEFPVYDMSKSLKDLYCPGSFVSMDLRSGNGITLGMPSSTGIFFRGKPVFDTSIPNFDTDRRMIGEFPEKNILLSGYIKNGDQLAEKTCLVWLRKAKGQLVLFAFDPLFRASTGADYKLLFNSILLKPGDVVPVK